MSSSRSTVNMPWAVFVRTRKLSEERVHRLDLILVRSQAGAAGVRLVRAAVRERGVPDGSYRAVDLRVPQVQGVSELVGKDAGEGSAGRIVRGDRAAVDEDRPFKDLVAVRRGELLEADAEHSPKAEIVVEDAGVGVVDDGDAAEVGMGEDLRDVGGRDVGKAEQGNVADHVGAEGRGGDVVPLVPRRDRPVRGHRVVDQRVGVLQVPQVGVDGHLAVGPVLHLPDVGDLVDVVVDVVGTAGEGGRGGHGEEKAGAHGAERMTVQFAVHGLTPPSSATVPVGSLVGGRGPGGIRWKQVLPTLVVHIWQLPTQFCWTAARTRDMKSSGFTAPLRVSSMRWTLSVTRFASRLTS